MAAAPPGRTLSFLNAGCDRTSKSATALSGASSLSPAAAEALAGEGTAACGPLWYSGRPKRERSAEEDVGKTNDGFVQCEALPFNFCRNSSDDDDDIIDKSALLLLRLGRLARSAGNRMNLTPAGPGATTTAIFPRSLSSVSLQSAALRQSPRVSTPGQNPAQSTPRCGFNVDGAVHEVQRFSLPSQPVFSAFVSRGAVLPTSPAPSLLPVTVRDQVVVLTSTATQTNEMPLLRHAWSQCRSVVAEDDLTNWAGSGARLLCELDVMLRILLLQKDTAAGPRHERSNQSSVH